MRSHAAVSPQAFLLVAGIMVAATFTWSVRLRVPVGLVTVNLVAMLGLVGLAFLVGNRWATLRAGQPLPALGVVAMAFAVAVATAIPTVIEGALGVAGLSSHYVLHDVVPIRTPILAVLYLVVAYLVGLRGWYAVERGRIEAELVDTGAANLVASGALAATLAASADEAGRMSRGSRAAADEMLAHAMRTGDPAASTRAADALRDTARTSVRGASHRLWEPPAKAPARVAWRELLVVSLRRHPLPIAPVAVAATFMSVILSSSFLGVDPPGALVSVASILVWLGIVFVLGRVVIRHAPHLAPYVTVACAVLLVALPILVTPTFLSSGWNEALAGPGWLSLTAMALAITVGASVLLTARASAEAVIAGLDAARREAEVDRQVLDEATARASRAVAQHVHGAVQPGLIAASLAIEHAVAQGDRAELLMALDAARAALGTDFLPESPGTDTTLADALEDLCAQWAGLLDVTLAEAAPAVKPEVRDVVDDVVQECLNNAYIHGGARHAVVSVARDGRGDIEVVVTDDGAGPGGGPAGLGSAILAQATRGSWQMAAADTGGTVVRAVITGVDVGISPYAEGR